MKTPEEMSTDVDEMVRKWPEVAAPDGGYEALVERTEKRIAEDREVSDSLDVFAAPSLPAVAGEPTTAGSNGEGPKLETLAALARESSLPPKRESRLPTKEPEKKESRSGVIDLKSMIAQTVAQEEEAKKLASALAKDGAPSVAGAGTTPVATTQPATPVPVTATAAQPKKSSSNMLAVAAIVLIAGVGAYVVLGRDAAPRDEAEPSSVDDIREEAASPTTAAAPAPRTSDRSATATDEGLQEAPSGEPSAAAPSAPAEAEPAGDDSPSRERTREARHATREPAHGTAEGGGGPAGAAAPPAEPTPAAPAATPAAETPAQPAPAPTKRAQADLDALISGSLGSTSTPDPSAPAAASARTAAPEGALPQPNRQQIQRGMGRVAGAVRACANGQSGMVMLRITFSSDGSVSSASVASGPFAGSAAAGCMENAARAARVPAFTNSSVTVSYPIMVQPPDPGAGATP